MPTLLRRGTLRGAGLLFVLVLVPVAAHTLGLRLNDDAARVAAVTPSPAPHPTPAAAASGVPDPLFGGIVALARTQLAVSARPAGPPVSTLSTVTPLGAPRTLLVARTVPGWVQVRLPVRPNTASGWVPRGQVTLSTDPWSIQISRSAHTLTVRSRGHITARYPVAVGKRSTPTPAGLFYVTDLISTGDPGGAFGPAALGLSGHSDVLTSFAGSDGVLGIHGTNQQASIGKSASHGCIRMRNADSLTLLHTVPLGTPVIIV